MQFLYPGFLWALLLLAIPIIIHLFYFRRFKKVYFSNVQFLREVKQETSNRNRLKNLLVLLARLLALAALVFAFAQPILTDKDTIEDHENVVSIFVDNSYSMQALTDDVQLFDLAKDKAREIITAYDKSDRFQLLTHDFEGRHQRLYNQENSLALLDELTISPSVNTLNVALQRQQQILGDDNREKELYIISDFQNTITDLPVDVDTSYNLKLIPLQSVQEKNVSIDSVWFMAPVPIINQTNPLLVKLTNYSDTEAQNVQLNLKHDGQTRPLGTKSLEASTSVIDTVNFAILKTGWQEAEVVITDYPIQFDDSYHISFHVDDQVSILSINEVGTNPYLTAAFSGLQLFDIKNQQVSRLDYSEFANRDLLVLNELTTISTGLQSSIRAYIEQGGNVLIFPSQNSSKESYNQLLGSIKANTIVSSEAGVKQVGYINTDEFIFNNVYENHKRNIKYPSTRFHFTMSSFQSNKGEDLLRYRDGSSFLTKYTHGKGNVYVCAAPLNETANDLVKNAEIFVPMLYKMGISKAEKARISYTIGQDNLIEVDNVTTSGDLVYKMRGAEEFIPGQYSLGANTMIDVNDQVSDAGIYTLSVNNETVGKYAFNYNRVESDMSYWSINDLEETYGTTMEVIGPSATENLTSYIKTSESGRPLWKTFIALTLLFLAIESLLLRFWK